MRTRIRTLAVLTALAVGTVIAGAQQQERPQRPADQPEGFKCPVCGSPCVSKAELVRKHRQMQVQANNRQPWAQQSPFARRQAAAQGRNFQAPGPDQVQPNRQQRAQRFDIDGDGELSQAERAALKAYRNALAEERGDQPANRRARQTPVEE